MKCMDEHTLFSHAVKSGVHSRWIYLCVQFSHAIVMKNIIHIMRLAQYAPHYFCFVYYFMVVIFCLTILTPLVGYPNQDYI